MSNFHNKTVWITGASSGIGEALAYQLAGQGAKLILSSRSIEQLKRVQNGCKSPERHVVIPLDLEKYEELGGLASEVWAMSGPIDLLINNAGLSQRYFAADGDLQLDSKIMNTNFLGTVSLTRPILKKMMERKSGQIAVVSSILGLLGMQTRTAYSASNHALRGYFESLRNELHGTGVDITMIYPGYVSTNVAHNALTANGEAHGKNDTQHESAMTADKCAERILKAIRRKQSVVVFGGALEMLSVYVATYAPPLFRLIAPRISI